MTQTTDPTMAEMREAYGCGYELWFQGPDRRIVKIDLTEPLAQGRRETARHEVPSRLHKAARDSIEKQGPKQGRGNSMTALTKEEAQAALDAIGQMTDGNARDFSEWKKQTSGTRAQWNALIRAEAKIREIVSNGR